MLARTSLGCWNVCAALASFWHCTRQPRLNQLKRIVIITRSIISSSSLSSSLSSSPYFRCLSWVCSYAYPGEPMRHGFRDACPWQCDGLAPETNILGVKCLKGMKACQGPTDLRPCSIGLHGDVEKHPAVAKGCLACLWICHVLLPPASPTEYSILLSWCL